MQADLGTMISGNPDSEKPMHFLTIGQLTQRQFNQIMAIAEEQKAIFAGANKADNEYSHILRGKSIALIFEKPSLRTRVSFDVAISDLGGHPIYLSQSEVGIGNREPERDMAQVLSRYVQGLVLRTYEHATIEEFARHSGIPVINGLSEMHHPCQILADCLTMKEHLGELSGKKMAYVGVGNFNIANSLIESVALTGMKLAIASHEAYQPDERLLKSLNGKKGEIIMTTDPYEAVRGADAVYTDAWVSMGQEDMARKLRLDFNGYSVTPELMSAANPGAIFMHDLPAHRGEEVHGDVIDGKQSRVIDEAENRLHAQRALLTLIYG